MIADGFVTYNETYGVGRITVESDNPIPDWVRRFLRDNPDMHIPTASKMFAYMGFNVTIYHPDGSEVKVRGERLLT